MLRLAYCGKKSALSLALDKLERKTGWPRHALLSEAKRLGIVTADHRREWTPAETEYIQERLGVVSVRQIAKRLGRTAESVQGRARKLAVSYRIREGYTMTDLAQVFGESDHKIRTWMSRGHFGRVHLVQGHRVAELNVVTFLRKHALEYDLRRMDQDWFKSMVFGR
jgi:hypothetical protein